MISTLHLLRIVPLAVYAGALIATLLAANRTKGD